MRHMLITLPVAILLSVAACGDNDTRRNDTFDDDRVGSTTTTERTTTAGSDEIELDDRALEDALKADNRDGFVMEANQALDKAEQHLQAVQSGPADMDADRAAKLRQDIQEDIRVARDDLTRIGTTTGEDDWKSLGREIDRKVDRIEERLENLAG